MRITRRDLMQVGAATTLAGFAGKTTAAESAGSVRVGLLTVKTGPLASGGIDMERALVMYLKERNNELAGRKVELIVADTAGVPATARTKTQELVERNNVHCLIGPLAAFEALAIDDYIRQTKTPTLSVAAAEDMTQRHPNPYFVRGTSTSAQCAHPMAEYCARELKFKRMITLADDIAYGQEMCAGFQRVFEENGGKIIQKLFPPLNAPDYGAVVTDLKTDADGIFLGLAGSNGFRFLRQFVEYGMKNKLQPVGGMTALDEAVLRNMGDEALGIVTHGSAARHPRGHRARAGQVRRVRQRRRQRLHPQSRAQGRTPGQFGDQNLSGCQPVRHWSPPEIESMPIDSRIGWP
jgi:branched-chain amino acid transport system substrate-binding protein